ncbi:MAG: hypothetical protein ACRC8Y_26970 [Chroococcales cyanobacterium]
MKKLKITSIEAETEFLPQSFWWKLLNGLAARPKLGMTLGSGDQHPLAIGDRVAGSKCLERRYSNGKTNRVSLPNIW